MLGRKPNHYERYKIAMDKPMSKPDHSTSKYWIQAEKEMVADLANIRERGAEGWEVIVAQIEETLVMIRENIEETLGEERAERFGYAVENGPLSYQGVWTSAFWEDAASKSRADIEKAKVERYPGWEADVTQFSETVAMVEAEIKVIKAEEKARPTWTHSQWMEAEEKARQQVARAEAASDLSPEIQARCVADAKATLAFYQAAQMEALDSLLKGMIMEDPSTD